MVHAKRAVDVVKGRALTADGWSEPVIVSIARGRIASIDGDPHPDPRPSFLLPGLIDAHVHLRDSLTPRLLAAFGITTAFDMGTWPLWIVDHLRDRPGLASVLTSHGMAIGPGGPHAKELGAPPSFIVNDAGYARELATRFIADGADYLKIVLDAPGAAGPPANAAQAYAQVAHAAGKKLVAHATSPDAFDLALEIGADVITHVPIGSPLPSRVGKLMAAAETIAIPTLVMSRQVANHLGKPEAFLGSLASVRMFAEQQVPILAGTDANEQDGSPTTIPFGSSLHDELGLLALAGLSPREVLRSATSLPAACFGLGDRGRLEPGMRADILQLGSDPLRDLRATRSMCCALVEGVACDLARAPTTA